MNSKLHVDEDGNKYWHVGEWNEKESNFFHREEVDSDTRLSLPAVEHIDGNKWWYVNDMLHREEVDSDTGLSLPAIEHEDGKWWYVNDVRHREDGPAIEHSDGSTTYYIEGNSISQLIDKRIYGKEKLAKLLLLL